MVTHDYLNTDGSRSGTGNSIWTDVVNSNCNVFLVLAGHNHGEARRSDTNSCGSTVNQVLQDYQSRSNGGDGWLRYFTFKPSENKIYAYTWKVPQGANPGSFETDADSQFTIDYAMDGSGNAAPVCSNLSISTAENTAGDADPSCTDADLDTLTYSIAAQGAHGVASIAAGKLRFVPTTGYEGLDSFTYKANDGQVDSNAATVSVMVGAGNYALQFDGTNDYVTFGASAGLGVTNFTVELWFKRTGTGVGMATSGGTGGLSSAVPLIAKGAPQGDDVCTENISWFLGIDTATNRLAADFETGTGGANHALIARHRGQQQRVAPRRASPSTGRTFGSTSTGSSTAPWPPPPCPAPRPSAMPLWAPPSAAPARRVATPPPATSPAFSTRPASGTWPARWPRSRPPRTSSSPRAPASWPAGASTRAWEPP